MYVSTITFHCVKNLTQPPCLITFSFVRMNIQREAWQSVTSIVESKAEVSSFCLELSKKLDMRYKSPPLPVDLAFVQRNNIATTGSTTHDSTNNNNPAGIANTDTNSELGAKIAAAMASNNNYNEDVSAIKFKEVAAMFNKT
jgi:hypothetical protein